MTDFQLLMTAGVVPKPNRLCSSVTCDSFGTRLYPSRDHPLSSFLSLPRARNYSGAPPMTSSQQKSYHLPHPKHSTSVNAA